MNKICTSLEQSKKLIELGVDVNTADMCYCPIMNIDSGKNEGYLKVPECYSFYEVKDSLVPYLPAWSLSALLDILAKETHNIDEDGHIILSSYKGNWWNISPINCCSEGINESNNPLDAAYEMIVWLLENKKL